MGNNLIKCWSCDGQGLIAAFLSPIIVTCDRCEGLGKCPSIMREWQTLGSLIKKNRLDQRITLRDSAKSRKISAELASKIERGIVDPELYD